tara:strand:+ start:42345 stop:43172 length:828 start_codon:yes stop_codon:yes gene_type:complete
MDNSAVAQNQNGVTTNVTPQGLILNSQAMNQIIAFSEMMAQGHCTVPKHLQGNSADCMAIVMQSARWNMDPFAVAQKTHIVNGNLGYEAQLVNAVVIANAPIKERLKFKYYGDWDAYIASGLRKENEAGLGVEVSATFKGENEARSLKVDLALITTRNSPNWKSDPRQQIAYVGTKRWARLYCPEVILGVYTPDEFDEPGKREERSVNEVPQRSDSSEKPEYTQDKFDSLSPKWIKFISAGKATPDDIIESISAEFIVPDEIQEQIRKLEKGEAA